MTKSFQRNGMVRDTNCGYLIYYYQNSNQSKFLDKIKVCCLISLISLNSKIGIY